MSIFAVLPLLSVLFGGTPPLEQNSSYLALSNEVRISSLSMQDQADDAAEDYTMDTAQTECSDDPADLEEFSATRLKFSIDNDYYLPVRVTRVRVTIRNMVTGEKRTLRLSPYAYAEIAANSSADISVLLGSISGGIKYFTGTSVAVSEGQYNLKTRVTLKSSSGEALLVRTGISLGASDLNRC